MSTDAAALPEPKVPESVQDHAKKLMAEAVAAGRIKAEPGDPEFAKPAQDGAPVVEQPKPFSETTVALPEPTETTGGTKPEAPAPSTEAQAAAAEAVAEEMEEWEFEDPDLQIKIPLKYPKRYGQTVKRAFPRRADYDRIKQRWGDAAPVIEPLLADGRLKSILPLIDFAFKNPQYGDYVWNGFQRAQAGLPLTEAIKEAAQLQQAPPSTEPTYVDPLFGDVLKPLEQKFQTVEQQLAELRQAREQEAQRQRETQTQQQQLATQMGVAHQDLATMYPGEFNIALQANDPAFQRACQFAREAGYIDRYGLSAGIIFGAQQVRALEAERLAATASPAAQTLENLSTATAEAERQAALASARATSGGAQVHAAAPAPLQKPSQFDANGKLKKPDVFVREMHAYVAAGGT